MSLPLVLVTLTMTLRMFAAEIVAVCMKVSPPKARVVSAFAPAGYVVAPRGLLPRFAMESPAPLCSQYQELGVPQFMYSTPP